MTQQTISNTKALAILHLALFAGQAMFAGIAYYLVASKTFIASLNIENFSMIVIGVSGLAITFIVAAFALYRKKVEKIRMNADTVSQKLNAYRSASVMRWAMLEAPALLAIICFLITGKQPLLIIIATLLAIFFYTRPTAQKIADELSISIEDVN